MSSCEHPTTCRWHLESFTDRFAKSICGDRWASDLFCFYESESVQIRFYLEYYPRGHCGAPNNGSAMYIQLVDADEQPVVEFRCHAWMETGKATTKTRTAMLKFGTRRSRGWARFVSQEQMNEVARCPTVDICCQIPRSVKLEMIAAMTSTITVRWSIEKFKERFEKAKVGDMWKSSKISIADFQNTEFCLSMYPKDEMERESSYSSLYFRAEDLGANKEVAVKYEMWMENAKRDRKHLISAAYVFHKSCGRGRAQYIKQQELREFAGRGRIFVCCNVYRMIRK
ncbi:hypothetical protein M3Y98_00444800 [Aphelenchoides besseyi]|nr:hypothetical protein M3Y98_00444800 [Aphelenchoides besseyi]